MFWEENQLFLLKGLCSVCAFKDPFGCETVSDSWYNQRGFFKKSQILTQPCSLFHLQLGATVKHYLTIPMGCAGEVTQVVMCPVLPVMYPNHTLIPWSEWGPGMLLKAHCYFGGVCSFHVLRKAAGQEQPDCPEMFASLTALLFPCQKTFQREGSRKIPWTCFWWSVGEQE